MTPFLRNDCCILVFARFLQHFALSSIGQEPILYDHLGVLFPSAELRNPVSSQGDKVSIRLLSPLSTYVLPVLFISDVGFSMCEKVVITIITGLPGSHKKRLCNFLVQLNKELGR